MFGFILDFFKRETKEAFKRGMADAQEFLDNNPSGPSCGCIHKKSLNERVHECKQCGFVASRDEAAALLMLRVGLKELGREPNPETILSQKPHPEPQAWVG